MNKETEKTVVCLELDTKELRKVATEIGYGATMGVCKALFTTYICIGVAKVVYHFSKKHAEQKEKIRQAEEAKEAEKITVE